MTKISNYSASESNALALTGLARFTLLPKVVDLHLGVRTVDLAEVCPCLNTPTVQKHIHD